MTANDRLNAIVLAAVSPLLLFAPFLAAEDEHRFHVGDVELAVYMNNRPLSRPDSHPWENWLRTSLTATKTVTGSFPQDQVLIDLQAGSRGSRTIAFGQVRRSRPPRIRFYVSPDADLEALNADWRGYHEFAHLLIPFPGNDDIWFTEGFASYYQYILQSRAGVISPEQAWRDLHAGFQRGLDDPSGRGRALSSLSPNMWRERAHRRVYWTGAAFFLRVDTRLRTESGGEHSLDSAIAALNECCMHRHRRWNARRLIDTLGELSMPQIWQQEYRRTIRALAAPDFEPAYAHLGLESRRSGLRFGDDPDQARLREAIAGRRVGPDPGALAAQTGAEDQAIPGSE
ncbi:MAG: hypothetical protein ACNA7E_04775 [Wenzhouxiangellaceae bacterium]